MKGGRKRKPSSVASKEKDSPSRKRNKSSVLDLDSETAPTTDSTTSSPMPVTTNRTEIHSQRRTRQTPVQQYFSRVTTTANASTRARKTPKSEPAAAAATTQLSRAEALELLRRFDLNMDFGPVVGISRWMRYQRALQLHKQVSPEIGACLCTHGFNAGQEDTEITQCIWFDLL